MIILKVTRLLAILWSNRAPELTYLDIRHIVFKENLVVFHFCKLNKTWKKGNLIKLGKILHHLNQRGLKNQTELCVIRSLRQYLLITKPLRSEKTIQLLKSYIRPHNPVSVDLISHWLKEFLRLSGSHTSTFNGDSLSIQSQKSRVKFTWSIKKGSLD